MRRESNIRDAAHPTTILIHFPRALVREGKDLLREGHDERLELMIQTQKKIARSLDLTEKQAAALQKMSSVPNFQVR